MKFITKDIKVVNKNFIPDDSHYVIVANHLSILDITSFLGFLNKDIIFIAKKELKRVFPIGTWIWLIGGVFIDRESLKGAIKSFKKASEQYEKYSKPLIIFPEGTRSETGEVGEFKKGSFKLAYMNKAKILPVTICGTDKLMKKGTLKFNKGLPVRMMVHKPVDIANLSRVELKLIPKKIEDIIREAKESLEKSFKI
jgi:1-acyl-sn-glycerol-3-phosphate acyltransferase